MTWFSPTPFEISVIEQLETAWGDKQLSPEEKERKISELWGKLEFGHMGRVISIVSPEGTVYERPETVVPWTPPGETRGGGPERE